MSMIHNKMLYNTKQQHSFNGLLSKTTWVGRYQKDKPKFWILLKQRRSGDSGISWTICKPFAPGSRQKTMPEPHHSAFYRPDALPAAQPTASKHWRQITDCQSALKSTGAIQMSRLFYFYFAWLVEQIRASLGMLYDHMTSSFLLFASIATMPGTTLNKKFSICGMFLFKITTLCPEKTWQYICDHNSGKTHSIFIIFALL